jgi:hypothetical protein
MPSPLPAACNKVETVLRREHELLGGLEYRLAMLRFVLETNDQWLVPVCRDVEATLGLLRTADLVRAVRVDVLAGCLGLPPSPTLRDIADASPEPWMEIFLCHRWELLALVGDSVRSAEDNRVRLVGSGVSSGALAAPRGPRPAAPGRPSDRGGGRRPAYRSAVVASTRIRPAALIALDDDQSDRFLLQIAANMVLSSLERVVSPSLIDFLS